ncbi:MAG: hypothetical protein ACREOQ_05915 [Gemmatimonadales bacterium]
MVAALVVARAGGVSAQGPSAAGPALRRESRSIRITSDNARVSNYLHELAGPRALIGVVGGGVLQELRQHDAPGGLEREIASRATQHAAEVSVRHGLAALMHRNTDYHYEFCECRGFGPRVGHAVVQAFTDRRDDGSRAFSVPRVAGSYAGSFAGLAWDHSRGAADVAVGTTLSFGLSALFNVARELSGIGRPH